VIGYRALFPASRSPSLILADQHHPPAQFYWSVEMIYIGLWSNKAAPQNPTPAASPWQQDNPKQLYPDTIAS